MKKVGIGLAILVIAGLVLAGCANPVNSVNSTGSSKVMYNPDTLTWNDSYVGLAKSLSWGGNNSNRSNASGAKITSNAHSADFPGILFMWDKKDKPCGYLMVETWVLDQYTSFTLTAKSGSEYHDITVVKQDGQETTGGNDPCYVFYIDDMTKNNVQMVFLSDYIDVARFYWYATQMISTPSAQNPFSLPEDIAAAWGVDDKDGPWSPDRFVLYDKYGVPYTTVAKPEIDPAWAGDGKTDSLNGQFVNMTYTFTVKGDVVTGCEDFHIAADNGFVMLVNGTVVANSNNIVDPKTTIGKWFLGDGVGMAGGALIDTSNPDPTKWLLTPLGVDAFNSYDPNSKNYGQYFGVQGPAWFYDSADWNGAWQQVYMVSKDLIKPLMHAGDNTIQILAYNTSAYYPGDTSWLPGGYFGDNSPDGNAAGVIFGGTVYSKDTVK